MLTDHVVTTEGPVHVDEVVARIREGWGLKRADMLPPAEIKAAALATVQDNDGATPDQVVQATSRAMGTRVTSAPIRAVIVEVIDSAVTSGELVRQGEMLAVAT